jgi:hypothetical protein
MDVQKSLEVIDDLGELVADAAALIKSGAPLGLETFKKVFELAMDLKELAADAPDALPELKDLDANEVGQLGAAAFSAVGKILAALKV